MGTMKELYTTMQELGRLLREQDPVIFDDAQKFLESAQEAVLAQARAAVRTDTSHKDSLPTLL